MIKMKFTSFASSSKGNCYLVEAEGHKILIELGISWKKIMLHLGFMTSTVEFALISHQHGDHSFAVKEALQTGIDVWTSKETADALGVADHHRINFLQAGVEQKIGPWTVLPFDLVHDVPCLGFLIAYKDELLLFVPDTGYVPNRFRGVTILAIECNFAEDILSKNILNGSLPAVVGHRIRRNHLSLEVLIEMLHSNNFSQCQQVYLLHLSDGNSDEARMIKEVEMATGIPTRAA